MIERALFADVVLRTLDPIEQIAVPAVTEPRQNGSLSDRDQRMSGYEAPREMLPVIFE
jgi:hypothetical protein